MTLKGNDYTPEQEEAIYDDNLQDVLDNTRWYLDNLEMLRSYMVSWKRYPSKDKLKQSPTPRKCHTFINDEQ